MESPNCETIDDYTEYLYNDTLTYTQLYYRSMLNYFCSCFRKKYI